VRKSATTKKEVSEMKILIVDYMEENLKNLGNALKQ